MIKHVHLVKGDGPEHHKACYAFVEKYFDEGHVKLREIFQQSLQCLQWFKRK